ncbi:hypothetical protein SCHPADRAFT_886941 [Schizopora paradoxa]|uniref:Uncharacterized protein n=1 Tax=Schizopora paradoxa TaxID=27342 RepID=A0A0H2SK64_9AGAM|nr:hypothetical protein SCHPADRAFT_886941 [Schizopora paradoxa]
MSSDMHLRSLAGGKHVAMKLLEHSSYFPSLSDLSQQLCKQNHILTMPARPSTYFFLPIHTILIPDEIRIAAFTEPSPLKRIESGSHLRSVWNRENPEDVSVSIPYATQESHFFIPPSEDYGKRRNSSALDLPSSQIQLTSSSPAPSRFDQSTRRPNPRREDCLAMKWVFTSSFTPATISLAPCQFDETVDARKEDQQTTSHRYSIYMYPSRDGMLERR